MPQCLAASKIPKPDLSLFLPKLQLSPNIPAIGLDLCCHFETPPIPGFPIIVNLGAVLGPIMATVDKILALIAGVIDLLNALLDQLQFDCPLEAIEDAIAA